MLELELPVHIREQPRPGSAPFGMLYDELQSACVHVTCVITVRDVMHTQSSAKVSSSVSGEIRGEQEGEIMAIDLVGEDSHANLVMVHSSPSSSHVSVLNAFYALLGLREALSM